MEEAKLSEKEAQNSLKVKKMLLDIPGLAIKSLREDLFLVSEPETEVAFVVDVHLRLLADREGSEVPVKGVGEEGVEAQGG